MTSLAVWIQYTTVTDKTVGQTPDEIKMLNTVFWTGLRIILLVSAISSALKRCWIQFCHPHNA